MFTGLVQDVGSVERFLPGGMAQLWIRTSLGAGRFTLGESIAVDGACLTVVETKGEAFRAEASEETLRRSSLGSLRPGARVNLERALALGDRLGGHLVLGHVDATGRLLSERAEGGARVLEVELPAALAPFFIEKGSVAMDGVSLTVNDLSVGSFSVALIPETQGRTTLGTKRVGEQVNLEADLIGKHIARLYTLRQGGGGEPSRASPQGGGAGLSEASLSAAGFQGGSKGGA